jgi:hypothetical protein
MKPFQPYCFRLKLREAGLKALQAAKNGRDSVTSLQNKVGRASWLVNAPKDYQILLQCLCCCLRSKCRQMTRNFMST